jgi:hypothetical protein
MCGGGAARMRVMDLRREDTNSFSLKLKLWVLNFGSKIQS